MPKKEVKEAPAITRCPVCAEALEDMACEDHGKITWTGDGWDWEK